MVQPKYKSYTAMQAGILKQNNTIPIITKMAFLMAQGQYNGLRSITFLIMFTLTIASI